MPIPIPPKIQQILEKKGMLWTDAEIYQVKVWLNTDRYDQIIQWTQTFLGSDATKDDALDIWQDFCLGETGRSLDDYIRKFDPTPKADPKTGKKKEVRDFLGYTIHLGFKQNCWRRASQTKRQLEQVVSIDSKVEGDSTHETERIELIIDSRASQPERQLERRAFLEDLNSCLRFLPPKHHDTYLLREIQGLSEIDTASQLNAPKGSVKGWLSRAKAQLRECLSTKGWQ